jgi:hypothetical protein
MVSKLLPSCIAGYFFSRNAYNRCKNELKQSFVPVKVESTHPLNPNETLALAFDNKLDILSNVHITAESGFHKSRCEE